MSLSLDQEQHPPNAESVLARALVFKTIIQKAQAIPPPEYFRGVAAKWPESERQAFNIGWKERFGDPAKELRESALWATLEPNERKFLEAGPTEITHQQMIDATWLNESLMCLLWALGYLAAIPGYDVQADHQFIQLLKQPTVPIGGSANLRPSEEICKQRGIAELWHWRARTRRLCESGEMPAIIGGKFTIQEVIHDASQAAAQAGDIPAPILNDFPAFGKAYSELTPAEFSSVTSIAQERHRAFNWLCGYAPSNRWSETPTDT